MELEPLTEVVSLIGSKEGIAHFPLAFIDPGDVALVPSPAYPVYHIATMFAGGTSGKSARSELALGEVAQIRTSTSMSLVASARVT